MQAYHTGHSEAAEQQWQQVQAIWSRAWAANYAALELLQNAGITTFSPVKPQRWVSRLLRAPLRPPRPSAPACPQHRHHSADNGSLSPPTAVCRQVLALVFASVRCSRGRCPSSGNRVVTRRIRGVEGGDRCDTHQVISAQDHNRSSPVSMIPLAAPPKTIMATYESAEHPTRGDIPWNVSADGYGEPRAGGSRDTARTPHGRDMSGKRLFMGPTPHQFTQASEESATRMVRSFTEDQLRREQSGRPRAGRRRRQGSPADRPRRRASPDRQPGPAGQRSETGDGWAAAYRAAPSFPDREVIQGLLYVPYSGTRSAFDQRPNRMPVNMVEGLVTDREVVLSVVVGTEYTGGGRRTTSACPGAAPR